MCSASSSLIPPGNQIVKEYCALMSCSNRLMAIFRNPKELQKKKLKLNVGDLIPLKKFRAWDSYNWGSFSCKREGHDKLIRQLETIFKTKYGLKIEKFNEKEAWIAVKHRLRNPHYYVVHKPDIIITNGEKPEDRVVIEYVNSERNFLFDLRGIIALSTVMKARVFVLVLRHSIFGHKIYGIPRKRQQVEIMSIKSLLDELDTGGLKALVH